MSKDAYKYEKIYSGEGRYTKNGKIDLDGSIRSQYGHENCGKRFIPFIRKYIKPKTLIDIGCGHNEFATMMRDKGIQAIGIDVACPNADIVTPAHDLPFESKSFYLVTSFDLLEHIPMEEIDDVLEEMKRVGRYYFVEVALRQAPSRIDGERLHPIVESIDWWLRKVESHGWENMAIMFCKAGKFVTQREAKRLVLYGKFS